MSGAAGQVLAGAGVVFAAVGVLTAGLLTTTLIVAWAAGRLTAALGAELLLAVVELDVQPASARTATARTGMETRFMPVRCQPPATRCAWVTEW
jgi:hypothetical protein